MAATYCFPDPLLRNPPHSQFYRITSYSKSHSLLGELDPVLLVCPMRMLSHLRRGRQGTAAQELDQILLIDLNFRQSIMKAELS